MDSAGRPIADLGLTGFDWMRLVGRSSLTKAEKNLARVLALYADYRTGKNIYPGNEKLARHMGYSKSEYVGTPMRGLRNRGWIIQVSSANPRRGRAAKYELAIPIDAEDQLVYGVDEI